MTQMLRTAAAAARSARILVFLDQDRAVDNFIATGAFARLVERHRVSFVAPPRNKRMGMDAAAAFPQLDWRMLGGDDRRADAWSRLAMLHQLRWRPGDHWRKVRRMRRLAMGRRERTILSVMALPGLIQLDRLRQRRRLAAGRYEGLEHLLDQERPDLVIHPSALNGIYVNDLVLAARRRGIPSVIIMNSWDNPSSKNTVEAHPDHMLVWGAQTAEHAVRFMGLAPERATIIGAAQFDHYRNLALDRETAARSLGLDPARPILLYGASSILGGDHRRLQRIDAWCRDQGAAAPQVLYRPYPWRRIEGEIAAILSEPWTHVTIQRAALDPDLAAIPGKATESRVTALVASDAVISPLSTIALEGLLLRRPLLCLYPEDQTAAEFAPGNAPLTHFDEILHHPDIVVVRRDHELASGLKRLIGLIGDGEARARISRMVDRLVAPFDESYADRLNAFVEAILERASRVAPAESRSA